MSRLTAVGLMSGTSYDGVDVALIDTDGEEIGLGPTGYRPYSERERDVLRRAIAAATNLADRTLRPKILAEAEELVTDMHAEAVEAFLAANGMPPSAVAVVDIGATLLGITPTSATSFNEATQVTLLDSGLRASPSSQIAIDLAGTAWFTNGLGGQYYASGIRIRRRTAPSTSSVHRSPRRPTSQSIRSVIAWSRSSAAKRQAGPRGVRGPAEPISTRVCRSSCRCTP